VRSLRKLNHVNIVKLKEVRRSLLPLHLHPGRARNAGALTGRVGAHRTKVIRERTLLYMVFEFLDMNLYEVVLRPAPHAVDLHPVCASINP